MTPATNVTADVTAQVSPQIPSTMANVLALISGPQYNNCTINYYSGPQAPSYACPISTVSPWLRLPLGQEFVFLFFCQAKLHFFG